MYKPRRLRLATSILFCCLLQAQGADKYTDENRPYEFGFKIDGQQHRHESKDKDGIIMGEFGFVTADDVYHVTVYATDKEGRFKILSMKNIHLKSTPESPTSARQGHSLALPPVQPASVQAPASSQTAPAPLPGKPFKSISIEPPGRSCSACSIPTTTRVPPPPSFNQAPVNQFSAPGPLNQQVFPPASITQKNNAVGGLSGSTYTPQAPQNYPAGQQNYPQQGPGAPVTQNVIQQPGQPLQNYPASQQNYPQQGPGSPTTPNFAQQSGQPLQNYPSSQQNFPQQGPGSPTTPNFAQQPGQPLQNYPSSSNYPQGPSAPNTPNNYAQVGTGQAPGVPQTYPSPSDPAGAGQSSYLQGGAGGRTSKQYNGPSDQFGINVSPGDAPAVQRGSAKPMLVTAQMQIVDKNTDIHALRPGEKEGLPPGLTKNDMTQLLYTFNYTVGFHGHFEEGYTNGVKKGYYYVTGRNAVRTRIDYVADDTGFHPRVSQDVLDLLSDDVPKPETEKDEKFGLKGYEFKWLYYPVDSKRR